MGPGNMWRLWRTPSFNNVACRTIGCAIRYFGSVDCNSVLDTISKSPKFDPSLPRTSFEVETLLEIWYNYEIILTACLMLKVYSVLLSASEYLQTEGLNFLCAWNMVSVAKDELSKINLDDVESIQTLSLAKSTNFWKKKM